MSKCIDRMTIKERHEDIKHIRRLAIAYSGIEGTDVIIVKKENRYDFYKADKTNYRGEIVEYIISQKND